MEQHSPGHRRRNTLPLTPWLAARQALEPQIAKIAAQRRTDEQLAAMHEIIDKLKECPSDDFFAQGDLDRKFHLKIAEASQNPVFPAKLTFLSAYLPIRLMMI